MCGILGFSGLFKPDLLKKMSDRIAHRGMDGHGEFYFPEEKLGLAHRRLSIIDLSSNAHQPMWDQKKTIIITFNGEIYNFVKLKKNLLSLGYQFKSNSDTEVLLNLYLEYQEEMLSMLNGIFAFAIFDFKKKTLFLARDNIGVKPLYYSEANKGFIFASELKSILEADVNKDLDHLAIYNYLRYLYCPGSSTIMKSIKKLPPGYALKVKNGNIISKWKYYKLPYDSINNNLDVDEAKSLLNEKLMKAVERQLVSDVPIGAFLSGGLDSSAIVTFASKLVNKKDFQCFTIKTKNSGNEGFIQDYYYAKKVAKHLNVKLNVIDVNENYFQDLEKMVYFLDEPLADFAALNTYYIAKLAKTQGIKVLLSGTGGDDIFSGYRRHYAFILEKYWHWWPKILRSGLEGFSKRVHIHNPFFRRFSKMFQYSTLLKEERLPTYFYWINPKIEEKLFSKEVFEKIHKTIETEDPLNQSLLKIQSNPLNLNKMLYLEIKHYLPDHNLNYTDKMAMAAGVEVRVPFLDIDLISFASSLPLSMKQRGSSGKWILKKMMESYLPKEIIYRPKVGFGVPLRAWMKTNHHWILNEFFSSKNIQKRGVFEEKYVRNLIKNDYENKIDASYTIFSMICIETWLRVFIDKKTSLF
jgi:asparagine synthase (glutamine-hydrolysing)